LARTKRLLLHSPISWLTLFTLVSFTLIQCGGDDDDDNGGGDTRPIVEIHMLENVTPRPPINSGSQAVTAVNGSIYKGEMGSSTLDNPLEFIYTDSLAQPVNGAVITYILDQGDGTLSQSADTTDAAGQASVEYTFSGSLGHAVLRAVAPNGDSSRVYIRANTLVPGATGQGQYVLFTDTVGQVIEWNGPADADIEDPNQFLQYLEYVNAADLVVLVSDANQNIQADINEPVVGVILTSGYDKTTAEGIGIGSTYDEMVAAYGEPDSVGFDGTPPPTDIYFYRTLGLNLYVEAATKAAGLESPLGPNDRSAAGSSTARGYRRPVLDSDRYKK